MLKVGFSSVMVFVTAVSCCGCHIASLNSDIAPSSNTVECKTLTSKQIDSYFVVAGKSVGEIKLGGTYNDVVNVVDKCAQMHVVNYPDYPYYDTLISIGDSIVNPDTKGNGIGVFIKEDKVIQIKVESFLYSNEEITKDALLTEVKQKYPNGELFQLKGSANVNQNGSKDLFYWVDKHSGIAFEFYETKFNARKLSFIYVFAPDTDFFPLGNQNAPEFTKFVKI